MNECFVLVAPMGQGFSTSQDLKASAALPTRRAKQFVDVVVEYVRIGEGHPEVGDDGNVRFPARVGEREVDVHCWFNSDASRACIVVYFLNACPPVMVIKLGDFLKPLLAMQSSIGGKLKMSHTGHVKWMGAVQLKSTDPVDLALASNLIATGIRESNRLFDLIAAFVAGCRYADAKDPVAELPFMNRQSPRDEPLN